MIGPCVGERFSSLITNPQSGLALLRAQARLAQSAERKALPLVVVCLSCIHFYMQLLLLVNETTKPARTLSRSISGLVAEYIVAIDVDRVRFPAVASVRLLKAASQRHVVLLILRNTPSRSEWRSGNPKDPWIKTKLCYMHPSPPLYALDLASSSTDCLVWRYDSRFGCGGPGFNSQNSPLPCLLSISRVFLIVTS